MPTVPNDDVMAEIYRKDPAYALALLNDILGDPEAMPGELLVVLRQLAKAFGGVPAVAERAELNPTQLYRTLSPEGNPSLSSLTAILRALDMRLVVKKRTAAATKTSAAPAQRTCKKPARTNTTITPAKAAR